MQPQLLVGTLIGLIFVYGGFVDFKLKRLIENTPTSKIRSIAMGHTEIYGKTLPKDKEFTSPFSKKPCVYYDILIQREKGSGKNSRWVTIQTKKFGEQMYIQDDTGKVLVNLEGSNIQIPVTYTAQSNFGVDPPANITEYLKNNSIEFEGVFGINHKMRYLERTIESKSMLYVMGEASRNENTSASSKGYENIIIAKPKKNGIFYISNKSEKEILRSISWKSTAQFFAGGLCALIFFVMFIFS